VLGRDRLVEILAREEELAFLDAEGFELVTWEDSGEPRCMHAGSFATGVLSFLHRQS